MILINLKALFSSQREKNPSDKCYLLIFDSFKQDRLETKNEVVNFFGKLCVCDGNEFNSDDIIVKYGHTMIEPQTNGYDCGIYLLYFFEAFMGNPEQNLGKIVVICFKIKKTE